MVCEECGGICQFERPSLELRQTSEEELALMRERAPVFWKYVMALSVERQAAQAERLSKARS